jgi:predicted Rdx family selenoprotein
MTGIDGYFPVPTNSRERNVYLPIWSGASSSMMVLKLSSGDGHDDLEAVTVVQGAGGVFGARDDVVVEGDGHAVATQSKRLKQRVDRDARRDVAFCSVDRKPHR